MGCATLIFGFQLHKEAIREIIYERWLIGWKDFAVFTVIALFVDKNAISCHLIELKIDKISFLFLRITTPYPLLLGNSSKEL